MLIYIGIFIITYLSSLIKHIGKSKIYTILGILLPLVILCFFSGIRYGIGSDYELYQQIYENLANGKLNLEHTKVNLELGFFYMTSFFIKLRLYISAIYIFSSCNNGIELYYLYEK